MLQRSLGVASEEGAERPVTDAERDPPIVPRARLRVDPPDERRAPPRLERNGQVVPLHTYAQLLGAANEALGHGARGLGARQVEHAHAERAEPIDKIPGMIEVRMADHDAIHAVDSERSQVGHDGALQRPGRPDVHQHHRTVRHLEERGVPLSYGDGVHRKLSRRRPRPRCVDGNERRAEKQHRPAPSAIRAGSQPHDRAGHREKEHEARASRTAPHPRNREEPRQRLGESKRDLDGGVGDGERYGDARQTERDERRRGGRRGQRDECEGRNDDQIGQWREQRDAAEGVEQRRQCAQGRRDAHAETGPQRVHAAPGNPNDPRIARPPGLRTTWGQHDEREGGSDRELKAGVEQPPRVREKHRDRDERQRMEREGRTADRHRDEDRDRHAPGANGGRRRPREEDIGDHSGDHHPRCDTAGLDAAHEPRPPTEPAIEKAEDGGGEEREVHAADGENVRRAGVGEEAPQLSGDAVAGPREHRDENPCSSRRT